MSDDKINFNFMDEDAPESVSIKEHGEVEIATSGNPKEVEDFGDETPDVFGPPKVHQGLTREQVLEAQRRAESPKGLNMEAFMKETGVVSINFEELLHYKVK